MTNIAVPRASIVSTMAFAAASLSFSLIQAIPGTASASSPELVIQAGHVRSRARLAITAADDKIPLFNDAIESLAVSRGRPYLATLADGTLIVWNIKTGEQICEFQGCLAFALAPDGCRVAIARDHEAVTIFDTTNGKKLLSLHASTRCHRLAYSADGGRLAGSSGESLAISRNGSQVTIVRAEGVVWDASTGAVLKEFKKSSAESDTHETIIWDVRSGKELGRLSDDENNGFAELTYSDDGARLVSVSYDAVAVLWDANTGKAIRKFARSYAVALSSDATKLATGHIDKTVTLWDTQTGKQLRVFHGCPGQVHSVAFSPDGASVAAGCSGAAVQFWNVETGTKGLSLRGAAYRVSTVAFSPNGRYVGVGCENDTAILWDLQTGKRLSTLHGSGGGRPSNDHPLGLANLRFSPSGKLALSTAGGSLSIWDVHAGRRLCLVDTDATSVLVADFIGNDRIARPCRTNHAFSA